MKKVKTKTSTKSKVTSFEISSNQIQLLLGQLGKVLGKPEFVQFDVTKEGIRVSGIHNNVKALVSFATDCEGVQSFAVNQAVLSGVVRGRGDLKLTFDGENKLTLAAIKGKYQAEVITVPTTDISIVPANLRKSSAIPGGLKTFLLNALPLAVVQSLYTEGYVAITIDSNDTGSSVVCMDNYHGVIVQSKLRGKFKISLPTIYVPMITALFSDGTDASIAVDQAYIYGWNENFEMALPLLAVEDLSEHMFAWYKTTRNTKGLKTPSKNLVEIISNFVALAEDKSTISAALKAHKIDFKIETGYGNSQDSVDVSGKVNSSTVEFEPHTFNELITKVNGEVELVFHQSTDKKSEKYVMLEIRQSLKDLGDICMLCKLTSNL